MERNQCLLASWRRHYSLSVRDCELQVRAPHEGKNGSLKVDFAAICSIETASRTSGPCAVRGRYIRPLHKASPPHAQVADLSAYNSE